MTQITLFKKENLEKYTLVEAFPGIGLVGPMVASYIVEKLKMEYIGYLDSALFPPLAAVHNGIPMYPARLYKDEKSKLLVLTSEFTIEMEDIKEIGDVILDFAKKNNIQKVISISGLPSESITNTAYMVSNKKNTVEEAMKKLNTIKEIEDGIVAGMGGYLITHANDVEVIALLVEVNPLITDPRYAETAIKALSSIVNIKISLDELEREAKLVESKVKKMLKDAKEAHQHYNRLQEPTGPSPYA